MHLLAIDMILGDYRSKPVKDRSCLDDRGVDAYRIRSIVRAFLVEPAIGQDQARRDAGLMLATSAQQGHHLNLSTARTVAMNQLTSVLREHATPPGNKPGKCRSGA